MKKEKLGVVSIGIKMPIIRQGDDLVKIIMENIDGIELHNKDIIGITESVVARADGQYITVDDIAADIDKKFGKDATIALINPIYSRNRFSLILKGIARSASKVIIVMPEYDEVGNPRGVNKFTGVNIEEYYKELCESENCACEIINELLIPSKYPVLYCGLHDYLSWDKILKNNSSFNVYKYGYTLKDICSDVSPKYYEGNIEPDDNTIFVFGSNPEGRHGAGAAKIAREKFGAVYGCGEGLQGNSYAIPTKDLRVKYNRGLRSISADKIIESIKNFYKVALDNPTKKFKVAYRNTDNISLNGYTGLEMIDMFKKSGSIPSNVYFSKEWIDTELFNIHNDWGVLGTNKATEEKLKLFPSKAEAQRVCDEVKAEIKEKTGKDVIVCVYGDGCFKDPVGGIWEFADPVTMPAYTDKELMESTPCELKLKNMIDTLGSDAEIEVTLNTDKSKWKDGGKMGTTPRIYRDLLASLMDLTSGSGDRATPCVLIQNYFN